jgi:dihydroorotase
MNHHLSGEQGMNTPATIKIRKPDDFHVHLRQGNLLRDVLPFTANVFGRALVMPNTTPAIDTPIRVADYRREIRAALPEGSKFTPLMTFKITPNTNPDYIETMKRVGAVAGKLYPDGVTTNSENGVTDFQALTPVFDEMEKNDLVLCLHGEMPGAFCLDREAVFVDKIMSWFDQRFPHLKIVLEHITTEDAAYYVSRSPYNRAATITAHHLWLTLDDVIGGTLKPHNFCKPIAKRESDRQALVAYATLGGSRFFLGSDSAPHTKKLKECDCGAAGVFSAPCLLPSLVEVFLREGRLNNLEYFTSVHGAQFYGLPLNEGVIELVHDAWSVPKGVFRTGETSSWSDESIVPFLAGETLQYKVVNPNANPLQHYVSEIPARKENEIER